MSTLPVEKLISGWKQAELTVEQMIGYRVQHLQACEKRIEALEKRERQRPPSQPEQKA